MKKYNIFLFFILTTLFANSQSFDYVKAAQVYWKYRYRLVGDYVTPDSITVMGEPGFLVRGQGAVGSGLSSPARIREANIWANNAFTNQNGQFNPSRQGSWTGDCINEGIYNATGPIPGIVDWTDGQGTDLGKYLAVLATEWKLLRTNGRTSAETESQLMYAMEAYNRLEQAAWDKYGMTPPWPYTTNDGLFYRDDVNQNFAQTQYTSPTDNPPYGPNSSPSNPYNCFGSLTVNVNGQTYTNSDCYKNVVSFYACNDFACSNDRATASPPNVWGPGMMSKDQAIRMLWGLSFVSKCVPSGALVQSGYDVGYEARKAISRLVDYIGGVTSPLPGINEWFILNPGGSLVCTGADCLIEAWALTVAGNAYGEEHPPVASFTPYISGGVGLGTLPWQTVEDQLFTNNGTSDLLQHVATEYEAYLAVLVGPIQPPNAGDFINAFFYESIFFPRRAVRKWENAIANEGNFMQFPYLDLASAFLNSYAPIQPQSHWQSLLTNPMVYDPITNPTGPHYSDLYYPNCWPCEMPLMDYTWGSGKIPGLFNTGPGSNQRPQDNIPNQFTGDQFNGLDYMLLYNLYCLEFPATYWDVANATTGTYTDLEDRVVTADYPIAGLGASVGTSANHLKVGAETSMSFQGGMAEPGTYVDFTAPHVGAHNNNLQFWAKFGSVVTYNTGRPICGSDVIPGTTTEYKSLGDDDPNDTIVTPAMQRLEDSLSQLYLSGALTNTTYTDSSLQDVSFTLNVYPNPLSSECRISLGLPTGARVSMEIDDAYGRKVAIVLIESNLQAGKYDYLFERDGLADCTYLLTVYVNGKAFARKLVII